MVICMLVGAFLPLNNEPQRNEHITGADGVACYWVVASPSLAGTDNRYAKLDLRKFQTAATTTPGDRNEIIVRLSVYPQGLCRGSSNMFLICQLSGEHYYKIPVDCLSAWKKWPENGFSESVLLVKASNCIYPTI